MVIRPGTKSMGSFGSSMGESSSSDDDEVGDRFSLSSESGSRVDSRRSRKRR